MAEDSTATAETTFQNLLAMENFGGVLIAPSLKLFYLPEPASVYCFLNRNNDLLCVPEEKINDRFEVYFDFYLLNPDQVRMIKTAVVGDPGSFYFDFILPQFYKYQSYNGKDQVVIDSYNRKVKLSSLAPYKNLLWTPELRAEVLAPQQRTWNLIYEPTGGRISWNGNDSLDVFAGKSVTAMLRRFAALSRLR